MRVVIRTAGVIAIAAVLASCQSPKQVKPAPKDATPPPNPPSWLLPSRNVEPVTLPDTQDTAREAAMAVAALPPVADPWTRREILLWQALFSTAYESNVGDITEHFLLTPPESLPQRLTIDDREFRLRVLAAVADWGVGVAWGLPTVNETNPGVEHFPGTRHLATRLIVRNLERNPDDLRVLAEVSDVTAHVGGSRQKITATWDGEEWVIERDPSRLIW